MDLRVRFMGHARVFQIFQMVIQDLFKGNSSVVEWCFKGVYGCFKKVLMVAHKCFKGVSRMKLGLEYFINRWGSSSVLINLSLLCYPACCVYQARKQERFNLNHLLGFL